MRAIDPSNFSDKKKKSSKKGKFLLAIILVLIPLIAITLMTINNTDNNEGIVINNDSKVESSYIEKNIQDDRIKLPSEFSGNEFRLLYDNLLLDNTEKINEPPEITGNDVADARIRQIAESRGYKIRVDSSISLPLVAGYRLQEQLREPWFQMQQAARQEGVEMTIVSGYRTIKDQKDLFVRRLLLEGVNIDQVAAGLANEQVDSVLVTSSIPGYSKHHSGYTIDLLCSGYAFENFKNSDCNEWLTKDNYANARKFGFIPSYPEDADLQGPDPEAWEYVYVGVDALNPSQDTL